MLRFQWAPRYLHLGKEPMRRALGLEKSPSDVLSSAQPQLYSHRRGVLQLQHLKKYLPVLLEVMSVRQVPRISLFLVLRLDRPASPRLRVTDSNQSQPQYQGAGSPGLVPSITEVFLPLNCHWFLPSLSAPPL